MTGFDPEIVPTEAGREARPCDCCVVALALTAARGNLAGRRLYVSEAAAPNASEGRPEGDPNPLRVESLLAALTAEPTRAATTFFLGAGGCLRLDGARARTGSLC
jgi:hypothetical protein